MDYGQACRQTLHLSDCPSSPHDPRHWPYLSNFPRQDFWPARWIRVREQDVFTAVVGVRLDVDIENQFRKTLAGSVRVARQAGRKHAAVDVRVITANAAAKASGSRGLT